MESGNYLEIKKSPEVYPPQEDTWFLTDILMNYLETKVKQKERLLICEIGIGTGYISLNLCLNYPNLNLIGIDVFLGAVNLSNRNISNQLQNSRFSLICSSLLTAFNPSKFKPDVIFFNPPYLKTSFNEYKKGNDPLVRAWSGGPTGTYVISKFLDNLINFTFGVAFFLSSELNDNTLIENQFKKYFKLKKIAEKKVGDEKLICYNVLPKN